MYFKGKIHKKKEGEKYHSISIPELGIFTQGKNPKNCIDMVKDSLAMVLNIKASEIDFVIKSESSFDITAKPLSVLISHFLKFQRSESGLSLSDIQQRLGYSSKNSYAQYEKGVREPSLNKLNEFINAMKEGQRVVINIDRVRNAG